MKNRIIYLDSIRGLAAISVVIYHVIQAHWGWHTYMKVACMFFNGADAVSMFFVLSGLVLALKFKNLSQKPLTPSYYIKYLISRIFRLYPTFIVMLFVYYIYHFREIIGLQFLVETLKNKYHFINELLLIRDYHELFLPDWTLGVELAISLLLPFFALLIVYNQRLFLLFILVIVIINKLYASIFIFHFCLGTLIAFNFEKIEQFDFKNSKFYRYRYILYVVTFLLYSIREIQSIFPFGNIYNKTITEILFIDIFHYTGFAAAIILILVINNKTIQKILSVKPLTYLGKISYSLYLVHWLIIGFLMDNWNKYSVILKTETNIFIVYLSVTVIITILIATVLYNCIEKPFMKIGKHVSDKIT